MTRHCHVLYTDPDAVTAVWNGLRPVDPAARRREEAAVAVGKEAEGRGRRGWEERSAL
uniref:Uncharacterized protein n=1 Tax=Arundo donax TaxID=35708 RepID=A0A0A9E8C0_ARUDO